MMLDLFGMAILLFLPSFLLAQRLFGSRENRDCACAILIPSSAISINLLLYYLNIPIQRTNLTYAYLAYTLASSLAFIFPRPPPHPAKLQAKHTTSTLSQLPSPNSQLPTLNSQLLPLALLLPVLILVFPYTNFTGIDTYKWQDLATAIRLDQTIPWLIHPVGLFGFLPRSYPSLQPILLANIQILGNLGVDGGFRVLSILTLWTGFTTARCWFTQMNDKTNCEPVESNTRPIESTNTFRFSLHQLAKNTPSIAALVYVLSPVFIRYTHWATGRGWFLALFPAMLYLITKPRSWHLMALPLVALLLLLSHKAAWIALALLLVALPLQVLTQKAGPRLPHISKQIIKIGAVSLMLLIACIISQKILLPGITGKALGAAWIALNRFSWLLPAALALWLFSSRNLAAHTTRWQFALILALPLAFDPQMYGAMIALPFIVAFAMKGIEQHMHRVTPRTRNYAFVLLAITLLLSASAPILSRSLQATPKNVKMAALFLNNHDRTGPFQIHAPDQARTRIQAYTDGSPRFTLSGTPKIVWQLTRPPANLWPVTRARIFAHTAWLRNVIQLSGLEVKWYGENPKHYYFVIDNQGSIPPHSIKIYDQNDIQIYQPTP